MFVCGATVLRGRGGGGEAQGRQRVPLLACARRLPEQSPKQRKTKKGCGPGGFIGYSAGSDEGPFFCFFFFTVRRPTQTRLLTVFVLFFGAAAGTATSEAAGTAPLMNPK